MRYKVEGTSTACNVRNRFSWINGNSISFSITGVHNKIYKAFSYFVMYLSANLLLDHQYHLRKLDHVSGKVKKLLFIS